LLKSQPAEILGCFIKKVFMIVILDAGACCQLRPAPLKFPA
jgi:hypothetical protein